MNNTIAIDNKIFYYEVKGATGSRFDNITNNTALESFGNVKYLKVGANNKTPTILRDVVDENHLLPGLFDKQVKFLFAQMPYLYKTQDGERVEAKEQNIAEWLTSWQQTGARQDYITYLVYTAKEYYTNHNIFSKILTNRSRRLAAPKTAPIRALECVPFTRARLATTKQISDISQMRPEDINKVLVGDFENQSTETIEMFPLFDFQKPFQKAVSISHVYMPTAGHMYYGLSPLYGLKDVVIASNNNYKYLNSFLKNSIAAKFHITIPSEWVEMQRETLESLCNENNRLKEAGQDIINTYKDITIGTEYSEALISELIHSEITKMTEFLSGEGENQGKAFVSQKIKTSDGHAEFEFKTIDNKYKEYIQSVIEIIKQSNSDIITGKGLDPSITGVSPQGIISKSGSDVYNNFLIYNWALNIDEYYITYDINNAIKLNFYRDKPQEVFLGFRRQLPALDRKENISPKDREI